MAWPRRTLRENWLNIAVVGVLIVGFVLLRSQPSEIGSAQAFMDRLSAGEPTVVYFFSNA